MCIAILGMQNFEQILSYVSRFSPILARTRWVLSDNGWMLCNILSWG